MHLHTKLFTVIFSTALFSTACKAPQLAKLPDAAVMPKTYADRDTTRQNAGLQSRDLFFKDTLLQRLVTAVLDNNQDIKMARQRMEVAAAYLKQRKGAFYPQVTAGLMTSATRFGKYTMEGVGNFDTNLSGNITEKQKVNTDPVPDYWLGLNASWEVDLWGKLRNRKLAAQNRFWASQQGNLWLTSLLVAQTATLYYELVALDKKSIILKENEALQAKALEIFDVQFEVGKATKLAGIQFKAQLLNTQSALYINKQQQAAVTAKLNYLAGKYEDSLQRSAEFPEMVFEETIHTGVPAQLLENRPDIKEAILDLKATQADANAARAAFFPSLNISASAALHSFSANTFFSLGSLAGQLLGGLTAPVINRVQLNTQFDIATAKQQEAFYQFQEKTLNAYREVITEMQALKNNCEVYSLKSQEVKELSNGVEVANELYLNGYANYLEIITAQKSKLEAQLELINTQQKMVLSAIQLYKATGGGWQ